jgi:GT2 family glycosyltransferase
VRVRFVIVLYNGAAYLENLLGSLLDQLIPEEELILVDNASQDGSTDLVREKWPQVRLLPGPV